MIEFGQLHRDISTAITTHSRLLAKFKEFSQLVMDQLSRSNPVFKGIEYSSGSDNTCFSVICAGRTLKFHFKSYPLDNQTFSGRVTCHLKKELTEEDKSIGSFNFSTNGRINFGDQENDDAITIDNDLAAIYVVLHFIHMSLSY